MPNAVIFGCAGLALSDQERAFFRDIDPLGFILFTRNIEDKAQVRALVDALRACVGRADAPVLIDQEGGRVARLGPPHWRKTPAASVFADLAARNLEAAKDATFLNAQLIAAELREVGITVDCAPLADIPVPGAHDIIGDRAYGTEPEQVSVLAREMARGLEHGGVIPVLKHIPGHGRARADSHEELPVVEAALEDLLVTDFVPFRHLKDLSWGMTAHILYPAVDPQRCATCSPAAIRLIREEIGFDGLLLSDDISMKALGGTFGERTKQVLDAGCDIVLHCNGNMAEMTAIAGAIRPMTTDAMHRLDASLGRISAQKPLPEGAAERLNALLSAWQ